LDANEEWNAQEEERCLEDVRQQFAEVKARGQKIACVIVEPILSEGGDLHASTSFFRRLRRFVSEQKDHPGCLMIVDEVQTGLGASGKMWAHGHWYDGHPDGLERPDIVTFSKKAITGGFYYNGDKLNSSMQLPYRIFNTWMGDPCKVAMLGKVADVIRQENLLDRVAEVGAALRGVLHEAARQHPDLVTNVRGVGTLIAFDVPDGRGAEMVQQIRRSGVLVGMSGAGSVRFRPSLTLGLEHVGQFETALGEAIAGMTTA
jgi:4-aminobutyrate aminotransferase/(S)-3-amino-2-methylpropionate transaminase